MTKLLPFVPTITPHSADVARCYDYGPSVAGSRMWWCSGLGTDTIVSAPMPGRPGKRGAPWHIPGKLVADPCAVSVGHQTLVLHTIGDPDGRRNGIGWAVWSDPTRPPTRTGVLIAQTGTGYGIGQPSVAVHPDGSAMLAYRDDGPNGENQLRLANLNVDPVALGDGPHLHAGTPEFAEPEDGASPEAWWHGNTLVIMVSGGGWCGVRTYEHTDGRWVRQRHLEIGAPVDGGQFWAQSPMGTPGAVDGLGVERDARNQPVVGGGAVHCWQAAGDHTQPGTWALRRFAYALPAGLA